MKIKWSVVFLIVCVASTLLSVSIGAQYNTLSEQKTCTEKPVQSYAGDNYQEKTNELTNEKITSDQQFQKQNLNFNEHQNTQETLGTTYQTFMDRPVVEQTKQIKLEIEENEAPEIPEMIYGPTVAEPGDVCAFVTSTEDPDGDDLYYQWSWGDGDITEWIGPYPSGLDVGGLKAWDEESHYDVRVRVKDSYGHQTSWSSPLTIHIRLLRGDMNVDGTVNLCDIDPWVQALCHPDDYIATFGEYNYWRADINCDGLINFADIDPFRCLLGLCGC